MYFTSDFTYIMHIVPTLFCDAVALFIRNDIYSDKIAVYI